MFEPSLSSSESETSCCRRSSAALDLKAKTEAFNLKTPLSTSDGTILIDRACQTRSAGSIELALDALSGVSAIPANGTSYTAMVYERFEQRGRRDSIRLDCRLMLLGRHSDGALGLAFSRCGEAAVWS